MSAKLGPYVQMVKLGREMALRYEKDRNLALQPLISHYLDEVEVNIASDAFDHRGFMENIRDDLRPRTPAIADCRRTAFLQAATDALDARVERHALEG
ncbi:hypothetical protein GAO09_16390 [Rhizobiales bacterium RZME27]|jgi:hypothetical protein|uniref:Uncharacterized protein n=1 Tax=Endobacterium cereale TaxID=2663029 RepID=A0A6A8A8M2_9HYPH|nr:hypothetical protein [Endobacterium cereale]MEB2846967.1 hypothetical protein [Endobacterium cereale]MQY47615.1 hypothetical protein [Endobacterium cereale]